jgi:murein DD-endopeptidase MepM/ murein hydrolase activator NlpD
MTATPNQTAGCPLRYIPGNDIEIDHGNGQYSVYYHLKQNSIVVSANQHVSAGQMLATSGNSGDSCGAHLHYQLQNIGGNNLTSGHSFNPGGKWTTGDPGRVPFQGKVTSESNSGTEYIIQCTAKQHWVKIKNTGGRPWTSTEDANGNGRVILYSTNSHGTGSVASNFQAYDWISSIAVTTADSSTVAPDATGQFTFYLQANPAPGSYPNNYFNLSAHNLGATGTGYFDYATLGLYYIPIVVQPCSPGC